MIRSKTAKLFEASARLGAVLANSPPAIEEACATYGQALGTAFQIIDDVLDYAGNAIEMGKNLGDDLREGKATLPLIAAMERGTPQQAAVIRSAIEQGPQRNWQKSSKSSSKQARLKLQGPLQPKKQTAR